MPVDPAIVQSTFYWLAGLLEGEGSFCKGPPSAPNSPRISISMTDRDVLEKVAQLFEVSICQVGKRKRQKHPHWKPAFAVLIHGHKAMWWMLKLRPLLGSRRQGQIDRALASFDGTLNGIARARKIKMQANDLQVLRCRRKNGESLRAIAKSIGVHHETVRQRLAVGLPKSLKYAA